MDKFYFAGYLGKRVEELHLLDVRNREDVIFISDNLCEFPIKKVEKYFWRCHQWENIGLGEPKLAHFWNRFYSLSRINYDKNHNHYVIFFDSALSVYYSEDFFVSFKKKHPHVKLIMYLVDQMDRWYSARIRRMLPYFDLVYAINHKECEEYGFRYYPLVYSNFPLSDIQEKVAASDLYFMGNNSDRDEYLHEIYQYLRKNGVRCDFNIVGVPQERQLYNEDIGYNRPFTMKENLAHSIATNCILEIMHKTVQAVTARYPEAIYLNKKLLTNNKEVVKEKFYDPNYVKIFDELEDIDCKWLMEREKINYGYVDEFSPIHFMEQIKKDCESI